MKFRAKLLAAVLAGLAFSAPAADPIRIGSFLSASGPAAFLGDPEKKVLELYVDKINAAGGIDGRPLELIVYDDGGRADKALSFAKRLLSNDRVDVIVGGSTTATTMASVKLIDRAGVPFISLAGAVVIIDPVKKWVFKTAHTDRMAAEKVMQDMKKRGLSRLALLSESSGFGKSGRTQTLLAAERMGIEIVADETYGPKDTDVTAQLTNIKGNADAEALLVFGFGQGPAIVTKNYRQLGMTTPLYQSHGVASKAFLDLTGAAAEGMRLPVTGVLIADQLPAGPQRAVLEGFIAEYSAKYGSEPSAFAGHAYDGLYLMVEAIRRAGTSDKAAVRDALEATEGFVGITGEFNFSASDHMGLSLDAFHMVEVRDGAWQLID